jgi:hypothetical protein
MQCPAHLSGRTDTVQVEPADGATSAAAGGDATAQDVNGLALTVAPDAADGQLAVDVPDAGVVATFTFTSSDATARNIVGTLRKVGG